MKVHLYAINDMAHLSHTFKNLGHLQTRLQRSYFSSTALDSCPWRSAWHCPAAPLQASVSNSLAWT